MRSTDTITIVCNNSENKKERLELDISAILYVRMNGNNAIVHVFPDNVYQTRMRFSEFEEVLGDNFVRLNRGCLVSIMAIHSVSDTVNLCNGESLDYVKTRHAEIVNKIQERQEKIIHSFKEEGLPDSEEKYQEYYRVFDTIPFAFTDIEMVFDRECHAIDWIFRYGNPALAQLEKIPLEKLIGRSFGSIFPNMDAKWLRTYERAALYGETLKIIDYSPEIDTYLDVICFPTFCGHCGCILFDVSKIQVFRESTDSEKALALFVQRLLKGNCQ